MEYKMSVVGGLPPPPPAEIKTLNMEDALTKLGGFSVFQLFVSISLVLIDFPAVLISMNPILTGTANVPFFCQFENSTKIEIPKSQLCNFNCSGGEIVSSEGPYTSIVQEWKLICEKSWISDTMISIQMAGNFVGSLVVAICSDKFGRQKAFYANTILMGISGILCAVSPGPIFFAVVRFLSGFTIGGAFTSHFNYLMEFLPCKWRQICGCVSFWAVGEMLLGLIGYLTPAWRTLSWVSTAPAFAIFLTVFFPSEDEMMTRHGFFSFIPESPRWALANGKTSVAADGLKSISRWNSKPPLSSEEIVLLQATVAFEKSLEDAEKNQFWKVFRDKKLFKILVVFCLTWFANAVIYFGLSYNMKNIAGDPYWNVFYLGMVDLPAELAVFYFSNRFGRRITFTTFLLISSVFLVALAFVQFFVVEDIQWTILVLSLVGKFFVQGSWAVMACFTSESFPTICRSFSVSICHATSILGGIIAPQLLAPYIPKIVPYIVFAVISLLGSIVSISLPEMNGKPLVDG